MNYLHFKNPISTLVKGIGVLLSTKSRCVCAYCHTMVQTQRSVGDVWGDDLHECSCRNLRDIHFEY